MKIIWSENPLKTTVELDEADKRDLRNKIHIEQLQELLGSAAFHSSADKKYFNLGKVREAVIWENWCGDESPVLKQVTRMYGFAVEELEGGTHCGDCTCVPASCMKCWAEDLLDINTIGGLRKHQAAKVSDLMRNNDLASTIEKLRNYEPKAERKGYEAHVPRWKAEASAAAEWLEQYRKEHFGDMT